MRFGAVAAVGLEGTLGHRTVLIRESLPYGQVLSIADPVQIRQSLHRVVSGRETSVYFEIRDDPATFAQSALLTRTSDAFGYPESSSSLATLLRTHCIFVVNSPQNLSVFELISCVFTSSGATQYF
jgi:hypothetical protein